MWVGLIKSIEGFNRTKEESPLPGKKEFFLPDVFQLGHCLFPSSGLNLEHQLFLVLKPAGLWTGTIALVLLFSVLWTQTRTTPLTLLGFQPQNVGYVRLHNHVSQLLSINLFILYIYINMYTYTHTHILLVLFSWRTLI